MKRLLLLVPFAILILACNTITRLISPEVIYLPEQLHTPVGTVTEIAPNPPDSTAEPEPTAESFTLALKQFTRLPTDCSDSPFGLEAEKIIEVAYVPSGFCFNGEIDTFETGGHLYVVQSLGDQAAFFITDVTDPQNPSIVGAWNWNDIVYTADVKTFKQGDRQFIVLSMEPIVSQLCGIAIVEVTDPLNPALLGRYDGENTEAEAGWCDIHTSEVSRDENGDGAFIYASAIDTSDIRVVDIRDLNNVYEINHYTHPDAGFGPQGENIVHDSTIVGDRIYVSYWSAGVIILDRAQVEAGEDLEPLNPLDSIAPEGLQIHHAYPTSDDNFLFVEDEVNYDGDQAQLILYDIRDLSAPNKVLEIKLESPYSSPHNLLVVDNLLYVGWYTDGVRVFQYDVSNPDDPQVEPFAFKVTRPEKTTGVFGSDIFDSIYGVRLHDCEIDGQPMTCIYASDLTRGLLILAMEK